MLFTFLSTPESWFNKKRIKIVVAADKKNAVERKIAVLKGMSE